MPDVHAILSPSSAHRWMKCTPSARVEATMPDEESIYSKEGTLAHSVAEYMLGLYRAVGTPVTTFESFRDSYEGLPSWDKFKAQGDALGIDFWELAQTVHDNYVAVVFEEYLEAKKADKDAQLFIEAHIDLDGYIPESFGTSDAFIVGAHQLRVYDLKYGQGVKVDAVENPQIMCYGLGVLGYVGDFGVDKVQLTIIQPRLHHVSVYDLSVEDLLLWGAKELRPAAQKAWAGEGDYVPGSHCKFCKIAPRCKALRDFAKVAQTRGTEPSLMTPEEVGEALQDIATVKQWITALESYAVKRLSDGQAIPGWKLVEGRSVRKIVDQQAAIERMSANGFGEDFYLKPRELRTITDLEKLLKKKAFSELLGDLVIRPAGSPTLAPESDPRAPYTADNSNDFND